MPYQDFRQFLDVLRQHGELIDIDRPIALSEIGKAMKQSYRRQGPAIMFRNGTGFPLVCGVYSTRSKALLAFQADENELMAKVLSGLEHPIAPKVVNGAAPCHEVVITQDIDITQFPIPTYSPKDGGPYITAGIVVSKDPETGVPDIGHYRFLILGKDTVSFSAQPFHRFGKNLAKCQQMGVTPKAALIIGVDPVLAYTCQVQVPDTTNDWELAGGLRGAPVELVRCKTCDLEVPATAEVVIEFEVDMNRTVIEGPLGEYTGYYTPATPKPVARVTAITHRRQPYFQGLLTGKPVTENHILKQVPFEASFLQTLKRQFPTVEAVSVRSSAGVSFYVVVSMRQRFAGEARQVILAALSSNIRPKWVIVVDPDIDVHNSSEVEWAQAFRVQPQKDVIIVDRIPAGPSDPSIDDPNIARPMRTNSAIGIDATRPYGKPFPEVADVPGWEDYVVPELDAWRGPIQQPQ
ncbi:MAG: UbiD family decarboxylase [Hyphomicrobiales bacterium]|nr:UbiD family decarboxylase [Hyphomicrobiales bacterium]